MTLLSFFYNFTKMRITLFEVSQDRTQLDLVIEDATLVTSLNLWTTSTYKDYNLAVDLSAKLTGSATETIIITLDDLSLSYFDGVYFIEAENPTTLSLAVASDLTRYKECIVDKILQTINCSDCLNTISDSAINAQTLLYSLQAAIQNSFIDEIVLISNTLDRYCSADCKSCGEHKNIGNTNFYTSNQ